MEIYEYEAKSVTIINYNVCGTQQRLQKQQQLQLAFHNIMTLIQLNLKEISKLGYRHLKKTVAGVRFKMPCNEITAIVVTKLRH